MATCARTALPEAQRPGHPGCDACEVAWAWVSCSAGQSTNAWTKASPPRAPVRRPGRAKAWGRSTFASIFMPALGTRLVTNCARLLEREVLVKRVAMHSGRVRYDRKVARLGPAGTSNLKPRNRVTSRGGRLFRPEWLERRGLRARRRSRTSGETRGCVQLLRLAAAPLHSPLRDCRPSPQTASPARPPPRRAPPPAAGAIVVGGAPGVPRDARSVTAAARPPHAHAYNVQTQCAGGHCRSSRAGQPTSLGAAVFRAVTQCGRRCPQCHVKHHLHDARTFVAALALAMISR
jgi:hypothetical protein